MRQWERFLASEPLLATLLTQGHLAPRTQDVEWHASGREQSPSPPQGYAVIFIAFHLRGFGMPAHRFIRELLHHYDMSLHELSPNWV